MIEIKINEIELYNSVKNLLSLCSVPLSDDGNILICDAEFAISGASVPFISGVIVIYKDPAYTFSRTHSVLSELYGERYASLRRPFAYSELIGTIHRLILVGSPREIEKPSSPLLLSPTQNSVTYGEVTVHLSPKEMALLMSLHRRVGKAVSRDVLREEVWGNSTEEGTNVVDVYISYLRRKLNPLLGEGSIVSRRGQGYMLILPQE